MYLPDFKYHKPKTFNEASLILQSCENGAILAGGTDLLVELKNKQRSVSDIVSLLEINELKEIYEDSASISIGAAVTLNELADSLLIKSTLPALSEAAMKIGTHQVRNKGTVGGNLCTGASCADSAPILLAYGASVELLTHNSSRIIPLRNFLIFHHKTDIKKNEIMSRIIIPKPPAGTGACFEKYGIRQASSISVASSAVVIHFNSGLCDYISIVIGACAPTPIISSNANAIIIGRQFQELTENRAIIELACNAASDDAIPIDDIRGSSGYRKHLVKVLTERAITKSLSRTLETKN